MSLLGSRPLRPAVEPAPEPAAEPEPTPEQAAETRQWEAELDEHLAHLKSLDPSDPHFGQDMVDALDLVGAHVGGSSDRIAELRSRVTDARAANARAALSEHLQWIDQNLSGSVDRTRAALHAFATHVDDLDPVADAEIIAAANEALGIQNPDNDDGG